MEDVGHIVHTSRFGMGNLDDNESGKSPWGNPATSRIAQPIDFTLTTTATNTIDVNPQTPDLWHVVVAPAAGVFVRVYLGGNASGRSYPVGGGGFVRIPADGSSVSFRNEGANTARVIVVALRAVPGVGWFDYDPGELA